MAKLFKIEPKHMKRFYVDQIERCRELLIEATKTAARGENGKPIFYTALRRVTRSGRTPAFSVHYFCAASGEMHSLNYVVSILLNLRLDAKERYVIASTDKFKNGNSLIKALSKWSKFDQNPTDNCIISKEL